MNKITAFSVVAVGLSASLATVPAVAAPIFFANNVCKPTYLAPTMQTDFGIFNDSNSQSATIVCPLKQISVAASTTMTVDIVGLENNQAAGSDVTCQLRIQHPGQPYFIQTGSDSTFPTGGWQTMSVSLTTQNAYTNHWAFVYCTIPRRDTSTSNASAVMSFLNINF